MKKISPLFQANDVDEMLDALNNDPKILVAYISLEPTQEIALLAAYLKSQKLFINQSVVGDNCVVSEISSENSNESNILDGTPLEFQPGSETTWLSGYPVARHQVGLRDEFLLQAKSGSVFNLNSESLRSQMDFNNRGNKASIVLQASDFSTVEYGDHRDVNRITLNLYFEGQKGVKYKIPNQGNITLRSPVITAHRGVKHPLCLNDETRAVMHSRRRHGGDRANLMYGS